MRIAKSHTTMATNQDWLDSEHAKTVHRNFEGGE
jgi:hypothetical protein